MMLAAAWLSSAGLQAAGPKEAPYEVWLVDQAGGAQYSVPPAGPTLAGGAGHLYIFDGDVLESQGAAAAPKEVIDLNGQVRTLCLAKTGSVPVRGHMGRFNTSQTHYVLAFVLSGHVAIIDVETRQAVECIDVGAQAHAAYTAPNERYIIVAGQSQKKLHRIWADFDTNTFSHDPIVDTLGLSAADGLTPNNQPKEAAGIRPDNFVICPIIDKSSRLIFTTLRGGGMFVVAGSRTPMQIVAEYDMNTVGPNGCGGHQHKQTMYVDSGGGTPANPFEGKIYAFDVNDFQPRRFHAPNTPLPLTGAAIVSLPDNLFEQHDLHGSASTGRGGRYLWVTDRAANEVTVVDTKSNFPALPFALTDPANALVDVAPDLIDASPNGKFAFVATRGACPTTANAPGAAGNHPNNAVGSKPGLGIIRVDNGGLSGTLIGIVSIGANNPAPAGFNCPFRTDDVNGQIDTMADPHGVRVLNLGVTIGDDDDDDDDQ